jgi:hypothetical protein
MNEDEKREQREFAREQIEHSEQMLKSLGTPDATRERCLAVLRSLFELAEQHELALTMVVRIANYHCHEEGHDHTPRIEGIKVDLEDIEPEPDERDNLEADYTKVIDLAGLTEFLEQRTRETRSN